MGSVVALSQQLQIKHLSLAWPGVMDLTQLRTPVAKVPLCGGVWYVVGFAVFMAGHFSSLSSAGWLLPLQQLAAAGSIQGMGHSFSHSS